MASTISSVMVSVPAILPTPQTNPLREIQPDGERHPFEKLIITKTPVARWGTSEGLDGPAVFLASDFVMNIFYMWTEAFWHI